MSSKYKSSADIVAELIKQPLNIPQIVRHGKDIIVNASDFKNKEEKRIKSEFPSDSNKQQQMSRTIIDQNPHNSHRRNNFNYNRAYKEHITDMISGNERYPIKNDRKVVV